MGPFDPLSGGATVRLPSIAAEWRRGSDRYDWFSGYLQRRSLTGLTRALIALAGTALGVTPILMCLSDIPPTPTGKVLAVISAGCSLAWALLFAVRWPTSQQSMAFSLIANVGIALACLSQSNPNAAIHACMGFVVLAGYLAIFHTAPLMVYNFCVAIGVTFFVALDLAEEVGDVAALSAFLVVVIVNLVAPFGIQIVVHTLGADVVRGDYDPLTGLLTRDAFSRNAHDIAVGRAYPEGHLHVAMVDLDRFKQLNDRHGHAHGDEALKAVGQALRDAVSSEAAIGRVGGEEFVIAEVIADAQPLKFGQRVCDAIARLPYPITASVGTAVVEVRRARGGDVASLLGALTAAADGAMYDAKRDGGDRTFHHEGALPGE